jgi:hypothetical protein
VSLREIARARRLIAVTVWQRQTSEMALPCSIGAIAPCMLCPVTAKSRQSHGKVTAKSRQSHGKVTAKSRQSHGKVTAQSTAQSGNLAMEQTRVRATGGHLRTLGFIAAGVMATASATATEAAPHRRCAMRVADGTGASAAVAKFQVYEGLLKATDWSVWAAWMTNGSTPGYAVKAVRYICTSGSGLGVSCRGKAKICKL